MASNESEDGIAFKERTVRGLKSRDLAEGEFLLENLVVVVVEFCVDEFDLDIGEISSDKDFVGSSVTDGSE